MKATFKFVLLAGCLILVMACSKSDLFNENGNMNAENSAAAKYDAGTVFQLKGLSLYKTWTVIGGVVLQDVEYENIGTIKFLGGRDFEFAFQETRPSGNMAMYNGKISASGEINFQFPAPLFTLPDGTPFYIIDIIKSHGCVTKVWGPGVEKGTLYFKGRFDGTKLYAEAKFMATTIAGPCPDLFDYSGDVHWIFAYDMNVVCE